MDISRPIVNVYHNKLAIAVDWDVEVDLTRMRRNSYSGNSGGGGSGNANGYLGGGVGGGGSVGGSIVSGGVTGGVTGYNNGEEAQTGQ